MKLLIRNLSRDTTEADLRDMFEGYGTVQSCNLVLDKETGKSKGFAFIEMPKLGQAKAATKNLNGQHVDGNVIRVKKTEPKGKETVVSSKEASEAKTESAASEPVTSKEGKATPKATPVSPYRQKKR